MSKEKPEPPLKRITGYGIVLNAHQCDFLGSETSQDLKPRFFGESLWTSKLYSFIFSAYPFIFPLANKFSTFNLQMTFAKPYIMLDSRFNLLPISNFYPGPLSRSKITHKSQISFLSRWTDLAISDVGFMEVNSMKRPNLDPLAAKGMNLYKWLCKSSALFAVLTRKVFWTAQICMQITDHDWIRRPRRRGLEIHISRFFKLLPAKLCTLHLPTRIYTIPEAFKGGRPIKLSLLENGIFRRRRNKSLPTVFTDWNQVKEVFHVG